MILFELLGTEDHNAYQNLSIDNLERQYGFMRSIINAAVELQRPMISTAIITALNSHAISCLHVNAGQYRPCPVVVGEYVPPEHYRVPELMNAFVNEVNRYWDASDPIELGAYVLWKLNNIHPFINGNGRTARALCYFVVCVRSGGLLKGETALPELIRQNRNEYVEFLRVADTGAAQGQIPSVYLAGLFGFISRLVEEQLASDPESNGSSDQD